jgi:hypothetical protein
VVDVGLFDALEELAGVGGEALDVEALAFGVDGVGRSVKLRKPLAPENVSEALCRISTISMPAKVVEFWRRGL